MQVWEAELAYNGYRRKEYSEWLRTQRIAYIIACSNSTKPRSIHPNDIVNLDSFDDLFKKQEEVVEVEECSAEAKENLFDRLNQDKERREKLMKELETRK